MRITDGLDSFWLIVSTHMVTIFTNMKVFQGAFSAVIEGYHLREQ